MRIYLCHHMGKQEVEVWIYVFLPVSNYGIDIKGGTFFMSYADINIWKDFLIDNSFLGDYAVSVDF